jgi:F-type H+-transporting ATPase subunit epsilon
MKLNIVTPLSVAVEEDGIASFTAEDASGRFGILPRHADFVTVLTISVASWTGADRRRHHCALRGGVLTVSGGDTIAISTREAVPGDDLARLSDEVLARLRTEVDAERAEHTDATRLQLAAIRQMVMSLGAHARPEGLP